MAEKVLSQEEMDALLKGVSEGSVDTRVAPGPTGGTRSYDLSSQERFIPRRIPTLEVIGDEFARMFQMSIGATLQKPVEFKPKPLEILSWADLARKIPSPSNINVIRLDPLKNPALLVIEAKVIYLLLDHLFGGKGQIQTKGEGGFTRIESRFIQKIVSQIIEDLQKAWQPVYAVKISIIRTEVNPQLASVCVPTEMVIVAPFKLKIHNEEREILFVLPYPTIEPIKDKLYSMFQSEQKDMSQQWGELLHNEVYNCRVSAVAELGMAKLDMEDVTQLTIGDVITLDKSVIEDLELKVEGKIKFLGRPGVYRGNLAFQVTRIVPEEVEVEDE